MDEPDVSLKLAAAPPTTDHYAVLGLYKSADQASIRKRYRALALENHPDRFVSPEQKQLQSTKFKAILEAFEVLSDADQRRRYDACLAQGRPFVPTKHAGNASAPTLADIFGDVDRFPFPTSTSQIADARLRQLINDNIIKTDGLKEKVIAVHPVTSSDVCESTSVSIRGVQAAAKYLVLTNFRILVAIGGGSEYKSGNTRYTQSYWSGITTTLGDLARIDLAVSGGRSTTFHVALYGPETALAGTHFTITGSPTPFLWLAKLYTIPIAVVLNVRTNHRSYGRSAVASAVLGALSIGWLFGVMDSSFWTITGIRAALLVAPLALLGCAGFVENIRSRALARVYSLLNR